LFWKEEPGAVLITKRNLHFSCVEDFGKKSKLLEWVGRTQDLVDLLCPSVQNPSFPAILKLISLDLSQPFVISLS
jgi:hypothetical protein